MNHAVLRKIAASTAVICEANGGGADMFFLLKAIYLADRQMIIDYGNPITGDRYVSMEKGPVPSGAYNLMKQSKFLADKKAQEEWDAAFVKDKFRISVRPGASVDTDCLAPVEEKILREKIALVMDLVARRVNVADWLHKNCPEWEDVGKDEMKVIRMTTLLMHACKIDENEARHFEKDLNEGLQIRRASILSSHPLLRAS